MDFAKVAPSKSLFDSNFNKWKIELENFIAYKDPDLLFLITEQRYEQPTLKGTMTSDERKRYDNNKRAYEMITKCLPQDMVLYYKNQATAYDLWQALLFSFGNLDQPKSLSPDEGIEERLIKEEEPQNSAFVAQLNEVDSEPSSCVSCIKLTNQINRYKEDSERLISENEKLREANSLLKENEKMYENKHKAFMEEKGELRAKIYDQQDEISSYVNMLTKVKKDLVDTEAEVLNLKEKLSKVASSNLVYNGMLDSQRTDKRNKAGIGYTHVPPPFDFCPLPSKDPIKDYAPTFVKADVTPVKPAVSIKISTPTFVKAESKPSVSVNEVVEVEDLPEEAKIQVEKVDVKPENHILTNETVKVSNKKGKNKVENESKKVQKQMKDSNVKFINEQPSTSTCSTSKASTSMCTHKCSCSVNASSSKPSTVHPPPKRFEGTNWNRSYVERRSCFHCGQQGHIIRDCKLLSLNRFGRGMPRTSSFRNSFSKYVSRRGSYSPVSSCASNSPKTMARVNKVVPSRPQFQKHNIVENKSSEPKQVWKPKSTHNTSMKSTEFLKYHKLVDVMIMDDFGLPKSIKAWVSHKY